MPGSGDSESVRKSCAIRLSEKKSSGNTDWSGRVSGSSVAEVVLSVLVSEVDVGQTIGMKRGENECWNMCGGSGSDDWSKAEGLGGGAGPAVGADSVDSAAMSVI